MISPWDFHVFSKPCQKKIWLDLWPVLSLRLAFFGHDLPKPTHLVGTLPDMGTLCKKMTKADRAKFRARLETRHIGTKHYETRNRYKWQVTWLPKLASGKEAGQEEDPKKVLHQGKERWRAEKDVSAWLQRLSLQCTLPQRLRTCHFQALDHSVPKSLRFFWTAVRRR